jgi:DNA-binding transcriptional ArsR family regulator
VDEVFAALADPTRRSVLEALLHDGPATATELAPGFAVSRQAVVKHLGVLVDAGLVACERHGREVHYHAVTAPLRDAATWLATAGAAWDKRLDRLARKLADREAVSGARATGRTPRR